MHPIIAFYMGERPDDQGRYLSEILCRDDEWLEQTHNYIQWLFPNSEQSGVIPNAPTIDNDVVRAFVSSNELRKSLIAAFVRMLKFYGLKLGSNEIVKGSNWDDRKQNWFTQDGHNSLRITRILKCLMALGLESEANMFLSALVHLVSAENDSGIFSSSLEYWICVIPNAVRQGDIRFE